MDGIKNIIKGDKTIWTIFALLCAISLIEVYSASSALGHSSGNYMKAAYMHAFYILLGVFTTVCVLHIPCRFFRLMVKLIYPVSVILLILVYICGTKENDAARWLNLGFCKLQPSEVAKGAIILAVAQILSAMQTEDGTAPGTFKYVSIATIIPVLLIAPENLSTAAMICVVVFFMMIIGRVRSDYLLKTFLVAISALVIVFAIVFFIGDEKDEKNGQQEVELVEEKPTLQNAPMLSESTVPEFYKKQEEKKEQTKWEKVTHRMGTWKNRIITFITPIDNDAKKYDLDKDGQVGHANIAIASVGILGLGPGQSVQRDFLPQAYSDYIYAIIIEEGGLLGALIIIFLYIWLFVRSGQIAGECANPFPTFLVMGLALMIVLQAFFNISVAVGLAPVTGQPLPLLSRGGTSYIITCAYIGAILSVSRTAKKKEIVISGRKKKS